MNVNELVTLDPESQVVVSEQAGYTVTVNGAGRFFVYDAKGSQVHWCYDMPAAADWVHKRALAERAAKKLKPSIPVAMVQGGYSRHTKQAFPAQVVTGTYEGINRKDGSAILKSTNPVFKRDKVVWVFPTGRTSEAQKVANALEDQEEAQRRYRELTHRQPYTVRAMGMGWVGRGGADVAEANTSIRKACALLGSPLPDDKD